MALMLKLQDRPLLTGRMDKTQAQDRRIVPFPIIRTKLNPPSHRDDEIFRRHLVERLDRGLKRPLTLIYAPAGYGKSTLVGQWLQRSGLPPAAWLWLDENDDHLERFVAYVIAAVRTQFPDCCQQTGRLLTLPRPAPAELLATTLLNELNDLPGPFVLVLDAYEAITCAAIHQLVGQFVDYQPKNVHLVVVSRTKPPLPLARLRARRLIQEVGTHDLCLSVAEVAAVLAHSRDDETDAAALHAQTEGWVAGLHLLANGRGNDRHIREYFLDEVLGSQPEEIRTFLLETSVLERLTPDLVATVCRLTPSPMAAKSMLRRLQNASLFVSSDASPAGTYQYHRLFQETLHTELVQGRRDEAVAALHRRAAGWLETNGEINAALSHWLAAGAQHAAADLVERQVAQALATEAIPALAAWLDCLPPDLIRQRPALLLADAWVKQGQQFLPALEAQLDAVELLLDENGVASPALKGAVAALRSSHWYWRGDAARSQAAAERARNLVPAAEPFTATFAVAQAALSRQLAGAEEEALHELDAGMQQPGLPTGAKTQLLLGKALVHLSAGHLNEAERSALTLRRLATGNRLAGSGSWAHYLLGRIYYEWDRLEDAAAHYGAVVDAPAAAAGLPLHDSHLGLAQIHQLRGERRAADEMLQKLGERLWKRDVFFVPLAGSFHARLALQRGETATAKRLVEQFVSAGGDQSLLPLETPALTRLRVLIECKTSASLEEAMRALRPLLRVARATHNRLRYVELLALRALVLGAQGEMETAEDALRQALNLAEPGGMIRVFVDLGPAMAALLYRLAPAETAQAYTTRLLAAFPRSPQPVLLSAEEQADDSLEPLTDRELEVLQLLGQRLSNKEIAKRLIISPYTVKKHTSNIYRKLDVTGRREASARARDLGLLAAPHGEGAMLAMA